MSHAYQPINIYCASCGAPASFDIAKQAYLCQYCGAETGIRESLEEKQGFQKLHRKNMERAVREFPLYSCSCTGCGATVVFPENEALTSCAFCGRALARKEYLGTKGFPELLIPFRITEEEAKARLLDWCAKNRSKRESREIRQHIGELRGFYLPYELVKGPTDCTVRRKDAARRCHCRGFLEGSFINTSKQLNNLLLDGMEPYDLEDMKEFDFSYLAGHRVKIRDTGDQETAARVKNEIAADYEPAVARVMETRAVEVTPNTGGMVQLSAVLPAYYLRAGKTLAAVNGQTGKVAVQESKDRFLLPWWLKPIAWTVIITLVILGGMLLFGAETEGALLIAGMMAIFLLIVLFTAYHNQYGGTKRYRLLRRIFTSDNTRPVIPDPEFYEIIDGQAQPVILRFTTPLRMIKMLAIAIVTVFLPLILAFLFNGFSVKGLTIGGAAVWLCITVPIAPVYLLKFGRLDLYEHPLIWRITPEGGRVRWRETRSSLKDLWENAKDLMPALLIGGGIALAVLIINVVLVLHWDSF